MGHINVSADRRSQMATVGLKFFFGLADQWRITEVQQKRLLGLDESPSPKLEHLKDVDSSGQAELVSEEMLERLSLVMGIRKAIETIFQKDQWSEYPHRDNQLFDGKSLIEFISSGRLKDLRAARVQLDALKECSGGS